MGLIDKWLRKYQDDWCKPCKCAMEKTHKQLFALPSMSACGAIQYRCPECGKRVTVLDPVLPVRDEEKHEPSIRFEQGELDDLLVR